MKILKFLSAVIVCAACALPVRSQSATPGGVTAATDSASRAIAAVMGPLINRNLTQIQSLGVDIDRQVFVSALATYLAGGDIGFTDQSGDAYIEDRVRALHPAPADTVSVASQKAFLDEVARTDGAITLPGGTVFIVLREGEGAMPRPGDTVLASYTGKFSDGTVFDSTDKESPIELAVSGVVPGFSAALQQMRPGGLYRIVIPADQAYGKRGITGAVPGNAALDFTVDLAGIKTTQK